MTLLIFYVSLALSVSFLCSIMEAVLLSVTPSHVAMVKKRGDRVAATLESMKKDIDRPLAAILSLNTIAHTVGAAGAGAQATAVFGNAYVGVISGVLTLLIGMRASTAISFWPSQSGRSPMTKPSDSQFR